MDESPLGLDSAANAARATIARQFGPALAAKASDRICIALAVGGGRGALQRALLARRRPATAIVEFRQDETVDVAYRARVELSAIAGAELEDADPTSQLVLHARTLAAIKASRDEFETLAGPIRTQFEHAAMRPRRRLFRIDRQPSVEACWLNRTLRTPVDPHALAEVAADPSVERVDLPRRITLDGADAGGASSITLAAMSALRSQSGLSGEGLTVGVIDSEIALQHPALQDRVIHRRNYTEEPFGSPRLHGTAIAGIIAGTDGQFEGVAPAALIYNYKVAATDANLNGDDFDGAVALMDALADGVRVVNCSWGTGPSGDGDSREARACDEAWRRGLTIVKSAGNGGPSDGSITTPGDAEGVIVVGATDAAGATVEDYSGRGPTAGGRKRPHLVAPGGSSAHGLESTVETGAIAPVWGTSYAAPHIAGLAGLLLLRMPSLTPEAVRDNLLAACEPLEGSDDAAQGAGLISPALLL